MQVSPHVSTAKLWFIYILRCKDETLYTGITNNLEKRIITHNKGKGAKYTKPRIPVYLVYLEMAQDKSQALRREAQIKSFTRCQKLRLIYAAETQKSLEII